MFHKIDLSNKQLLWPVLDSRQKGEPELILLWKSAGRRRLKLASNCPYELWLDGVFVGDGGRRCAPGEVILDEWDEAVHAKDVVVRLHWLNRKKSSVWYRCLFDDPFWADLSDDAHWTCRVDHSMRFREKVSAQLPRQNTIVPADSTGAELALRTAELNMHWDAVGNTIAKPRYLATELVLKRSMRLKGSGTGSFEPESAHDVAVYLRQERPCALCCDTYELGQIALHRFEVDTPSGAVGLYYSEVPDFADAWSTRNRAKVHLADAVAGGIENAALFGTRGCRYVHVLYAAIDRDRPRIRAWRREYPIRWKAVNVDPRFKHIVEACKTNLIACVDGGIVDTCWRERTQWTGDLRMSAMALRALADNPEVVDLSLHQIAQSYDPQIGMVKGAWPIKHADYREPGIYMPTYHLAFCLAAVEQDSKLERDPLIREVVLQSLQFWKQNYTDSKLLCGMPGWYFTDWDTTYPKTWSSRIKHRAPHAVCNAWWNDLCELLDPESCISPVDFDKAFWTGKAYSLTADQKQESIHATSVALCSGVARNHKRESLDYLDQEIRSGAVYQKVTAYFAYFVAKALQAGSHCQALTFAEQFYGPIARKYGTIYEKTSGSASLAHGWSVAIASLLVT